ncbi:MAG: hypothetical protein RLZZ578_1009, partial [Bacteroidota bacterium]
LIGDVSYGGNAIAYTGIKSTALKRKAQECLEIMKRQALHARILGFQHPITQEHLLFEQPPPVDFTQVAELAEIRIPDDLLVFYPQTK